MSFPIIIEALRKPRGAAKETGLDTGEVAFSPLIPHVPTAKELGFAVPLPACVKRGLDEIRALNKDLEITIE